MSDITRTRPNADQMDRLIDGVSAVTSAILSQTSRPDTWQQVQLAVNLGTAKKMLPIGDQILDKWTKAAGGTEQVVAWDVMHHYENGDMALSWHYAFPDAIQFDAPEALFYAPAGGLAAGQYYVEIKASYGTGWVVGECINFTLTDAMAEGDQFFVDCGTNNANNPTDGRAWRTYAKGSTTVKLSGTTSNSTDGTKFGETDANAHKTNGNINAASRVVYGSGRWSQSAVRQWLNSAAAAGSWWTAQNEWDRPPSQATTLRGFLAGFSEDFLSVLDPVPVVTALNTQEGFAETTETTMDRIFLPSLQEMYVTPQLADVEGVDWDYNKILAQETGLSGKFAQYGTYEILRKYNLENKSSPVHVWLRSCGRSHAYSAWNVGNTGNVSTYAAYGTYRGCPACKIRKLA